MYTCILLIDRFSFLWIVCNLWFISCLFVHLFVWSFNVLFLFLFLEWWGIHIIFMLYQYVSDSEHYFTNIWTVIVVTMKVGYTFLLQCSQYLSCMYISHSINYCLHRLQHCFDLGGVNHFRNIFNQIIKNVGSKLDQWKLWFKLPDIYKNAVLFICYV